VQVNITAAAADDAFAPQALNPPVRVSIGCGIRLHQHGHGNAAVRDEHALPVPHLVQQGAQAVLRGGNGGRCHEAIIAFLLASRKTKPPRTANFPKEI
jgi:hypothetical protein